MHFIVNYIWQAGSLAVTDADFELVKRLTVLYIQRSLKICIIISPMVNGNDFRVSVGFSQSEVPLV